MRRKIAKKWKKELLSLGANDIKERFLTNPEGRRKNSAYRVSLEDKLRAIEEDQNKNEKEPTREQLLNEWKERLSLHEWRIKLNDCCAPDDMALEDCAACTDWNETIKAARIEILDPKYYGERIVPFDWEKTLVHELLHLKTCLVSDHVENLQSRYMHQMIDDLARAFVDAKRSTIYEQK